MHTRNPMIRFPLGWAQAAQERLISFPQQAQWEQCCVLNERLAFLKKSQKGPTLYLYMYL